VAILAVAFTAGNLSTSLFHVAGLAAHPTAIIYNNHVHTTVVATASALKKNPYSRTAKDSID
jgi:hypothetical protein